MVMPAVPWLPVTLLICADELCIGQYVALHCSLDLRFRRVSATEDYERAIANYNNCILDHTANLSACEKQRAIMNAEGKVLPRSSLSQSNKIIDVER
jgi:hypothetical protein